MRLVNYIDRETSEVKQIRAIKNPIISKYEILVPLNYMILGESDSINCELKQEFINPKCNTISIINLNPKPIDYILFVHLSESDAIECFKYIVANCLYVTIYLNQDNTLDDIEIAYTIDGEYDQYGNNNVEFIHLLHEDDKFDPDAIHIAREYYD